MPNELKHFGVLGMRWGRRNQKFAGKASAYSRFQSGAKKLHDTGKDNDAEVIKLATKYDKELAREKASDRAAIKVINGEKVYGKLAGSKVLKARVSELKQARIENGRNLANISINTFAGTILGMAIATISSGKMDIRKAGLVGAGIGAGVGIGRGIRSLQEDN